MTLKILIIDDHEPSATLLMWAMQAAGYEAKAVFNGFDAAGIINFYVPDIVLSDINMPFVNGYELCELLRDEPQLKNALFIAQTGWNSDSRKKLSGIAGFHHHLPKPIDIEILLGIIRREFRVAKAG